MSVSHASAAYRGRPGACGRAKSYAPTITPSSGRPGTLTTVAGRLPQFGENGKAGAPTTKLAVWWNLSFQRYFTAVADHPTPDRPGQVIELGESHVPTPNPCAYNVAVRVPNVPAGRYRVVLLGFGGGGFASFVPVSFTVR